MARGKALEALEKPKAEERQKASQANPGEKVGQRKGASDLDAPSAGLSNGRTDTKVATAVGMGKDTYRKASAVVEAAETDPQLFGDLPQRMDQKGKALEALEKPKAEERKQEGRKEGGKTAGRSRPKKASSESDEAYSPGDHDRGRGGEMVTGESSDLKKLHPSGVTTPAAQQGRWLRCRAVLSPAPAGRQNR